MDELLPESRKRDLYRICKRYGVKRLDLFGSATTEKFDPRNSDLDFVISFEPRNPARLFDRYFGLKEELERLFGREVDLLMEEAIKNPYLAKSIEQSRKPFYAA